MSDMHTWYGLVFGNDCSSGWRVMRTVVFIGISIKSKTSAALKICGPDELELEGVSMMVEQ
jgi:hypothetical protein